MKPTTNIFLLLLFTIPFLSISCTNDGPIQPKEPEKQIMIDSELIGTWKGIGILPRTLTFSQSSETEGAGVKITEDLHKICENVGADYLNRVDFKWNQTKIVQEGWSSFFYDELNNFDCGGAKELPRLAFERTYKIENDTLYLGTEDYSIYVRMQ